ncbi:VOC family protein [Chelativorans sp.]|uniref:VOC family protein n=1 Tax=Chelativorans sp. TaxID=2203393 RepID=UPI002811315A|nr:VOC family protein [Chelativorans sp.]
MSPFLPAQAAVWFEIPVTDMNRARTFYGAVLQNELADMEGPNPMARFAARDEDSVAGHIYPGKPAPEGTGITIHLAVAAPLEAAMERVTANGGKVVSPIIPIPAGRFVYCLDPDGNSFGLFA